MWQSAKNVYHLFQGMLALTLYRFPGRGMTIIGVTGTDGKTTTSSIIYHILHAAGYKAALITSLSAIIDGKASDIGYHVTTPGRFAIQSYLQKAKKAGTQFVVLEITSHALDQHRAYGIPFAAGVLTNVNREHLDYHKTYERYVHAKAKLLKAAKFAVVNKDDSSYNRIKKIELKKYKNKIITYGFKKDSDVNPHNFPFRTKLLGRFNEYNCLAAITVLREFDISDEAIRKGIASFKAPAGRQEIVYDNEFMIINDFAHTPQSFAAILPEVKKITKKRLIHVFGSAALRDTYKRPEMGKLSSEYADIMIVTAEDPRHEPIEKITNEIVAGIKDPKRETVSKEAVTSGQVTLQSGKKYLVRIPDRKEAICFAVSIAQRGDVLLLTGKGHEKSINYGKGEEPWSEKEIALEAVKQK